MTEWASTHVMYLLLSCSHPSVLCICWLEVSVDRASTVHCSGASLSRVSWEMERHRNREMNGVKSRHTTRNCWCWLQETVYLTSGALLKILSRLFHSWRLRFGRLTMILMFVKNRWLELFLNDSTGDYAYRYNVIEVMKVTDLKTDLREISLSSETKKIRFKSKISLM